MEDIASALIVTQVTEPDRERMATRAAILLTSDVGANVGDGNASTNVAKGLNEGDSAVTNDVQRSHHARSIRVIVIRN